MLPPRLGARERTQLKGYRVSDGTEHTKRNVEDNITDPPNSFAIGGPRRTCRTDVDALGFRTVAHIARSTNETGTHAKDDDLCGEGSARHHQNFGRLLRELSVE